MRSAIAGAFQRVCRDRRADLAVRTLPVARALTFEDLWAQFSSIHAALTGAGIGNGTVAVSFVGNRPVFFPLVAAAMEAGTALVAGGEATEAEALALVAQTGANAVITDRPLPVSSPLRVKLADGVSLLRLHTPAACRHYGSSVVLKLTSGSTDLPRAAIASEAHLINDGRHIVTAMGIGARDINFSCIPLSHSYAVGNVVMPLLWQGTAAVLRQSFSPSQFVQDVSASRASVFPGVPFMFDRLRTSGIERLPASLRLLITAGSRTDVDTVRWFRQHLNRKVHSFYGSSETGGITYDDGEDVDDPLHVGRPMPETTVVVRPGDDEDEVGRIFVRGTAVCLGYGEVGSEGSASTFRDGGFLTGDLGRFDDRGRLVLTGRASTLVNVAGRKVDPSEVERALLGLPGIADVRVLGMSCDVRGQQVVAFVIRDDSTLTSVAIRTRCASALSPHKIPRQFVFLDRFPVDARGKIDQRALQALASATRDPRHE